ncbi:rhomboid family intramembrane serine protease [Gallaecimonas sp. GXIMD4217]|uniref:rhomboid family intramembrane serine protease n=1 Tax=Gallaecimonas sp. GXIMD4217 TaxID=3131927 RepID=UPI00311B0742
MAHKICPHCNKDSLVASHYQGEEIDLCRRCGGLWFEKGELNQSLATADPERDRVGVEECRGSHLGATHLRCPDCTKPMDRHQLLPGYEVEVEACHNCQGIWIERKELKEAHQASILELHLGELNAKVNWKSWVFQFLSQMPVEYNIKPKRRPWMTWLLVVVNVLVFLAGLATPQLDELLFGGALVPADIANGRNLFSLLSSQFLHGGWMHLLGNLYFLWLTGDNLEDALGPWRFLGLYLLCGMVAGLAQTAMEPGSVIPMVGASGAIAGLFGMYLLWFRKASLSFMIVIYQKKLAPWLFFLIWLGFNLLGMATGQQGVAYMAHIGGFAAGLALGLALRNWVLGRYPVLAIINQPAFRVAR